GGGRRADQKPMGGPVLPDFMTTPPEGIMPRTYSNRELWNRLPEVGAFRDKSGGQSTMLDAAASKGDASFTVAAGGSITQDMWLRIGTGSAAELVKVKSV